MGAEFKRRKFFETLGASGNVLEACRASGLTSGGVYGLRRRDAAFRDAWEAALADGYARLESELLDRALNGVEKPIIVAGEVRGHVREYSDRLALALLAAHRASVKGGVRIETHDEMRAAIGAEVAGIAERLKAGDDGDA